VGTPDQPLRHRGEQAGWFSMPRQFCAMILAQPCDLGPFPKTAYFRQIGALNGGFRALTFVIQQPELTRLSL
jgi:hypothetical protein